MNWYVASMLLHKGPLLNPSATYLVREYHCLVAAASHDLAYQSSLDLGGSIARELGRPDEPGTPENSWYYYGLSDLLMVYEQPVDGAELLWSQEELTAEQQLEIRNKEELRAFNTGQGETVASGWYVATLVLVEIHDTGTHGQKLLTWANSYLMKAGHAEGAYLRALEIGRTQRTDPGSHECDGDKAHWEFKGIRDLVQTLDPPGDRTKLWFDQFETSANQLKSRAAKKSDLGVFMWEAQRRNWT